MNYLSHKSKCVLSTRPIDDALNDCKVLLRKGVLAYPSPSMEIIKNTNFNLKGDFRGIILTSRHSAFICSKIINKYLPVYCVGSSTAKIARLNGAKNLIIGNSDSSYLIKKIQSDCPKKSKLFWATDKNNSSDIVNQLKAIDISVERENVYLTRPCEKIDRNSKELIEKKCVKVILFYSRRSTEMWIQLIKDSNLYELLTSIKLVAISSQIPEKLSSFKELNFETSRRKRRASVLAKGYEVFSRMDLF